MERPEKKAAPTPHAAVSFSWDEYQLCVQLRETLEQSHLLELLPSPWLSYFEQGIVKM